MANNEDIVMPYAGSMSMGATYGSRRRRACTSSATSGASIRCPLVSFDLAREGSERCQLRCRSKGTSLGGSSKLTISMYTHTF